MSASVGFKRGCLDLNFTLPCSLPDLVRSAIMPVIPCLWLVIPILDYILGEASAVKVQNVNVQTQYGILQGTRMQEKYGLKSGETYPQLLHFVTMVFEPGLII